MAKTRTPSPIPLTNDIYGTWKSLTIAAGLELDVFTLIADGKRTAAEVAAAARADSSAMRRLLDVLVALKYLRRKGDLYALEPISATFLARGGDLYFEGGAQFVKGGAMAFSQLADVVRSGRPLAPPGAEAAVQFFTIAGAGDISDELRTGQGGGSGDRSGAGKEDFSDPGLSQPAQERGRFPLQKPAQRRV